MPRYAELPNGTRLEFPDETPDTVMDKVVKGHLAPQTQPDQPKSSTWDDIKGGLASGPINAFIGIKQLLGQGDELDKQRLAMNNEAAAKAPVSAVAGNLAMLAPTAFIPGANTAAGASTIGAVTGLINPADSLSERAMNIGVGGVAGAGGQVLGNKLAQALTSKLGKSTATADVINKLNSPRAETLRAGQDAGYVIPPSAVNPTFLGNRMEGIAGKAALKQESAIRNQEVTNALARKSLGVPDDVPLSNQALEQIRKDAGAVYKEVGDLSPIAKQDLEALKNARFEAQSQFNFYNRSGNPEALVKAKEARDLTSMLEDSLENEASQAGKPELVQALKDARVKIAKTYTVGRALNDSTGDVSARVIGSLAAKGKPLTEELKTVGRFQQAFPQFMGNAEKTPAAGVSKVEGLAAALLAGGGAAAVGPAGLAAGGLALLSSPARSAMLSKAVQNMSAKVPNQSPAVSLKLIEALMNKKALQGALPALTAQGVLSAESGF